MTRHIVVVVGGPQCGRVTVSQGTPRWLTDYVLIDTSNLPALDFVRLYYHAATRELLTNGARKR